MLFRVAFASLALVTFAAGAEAYSLASAIGEPCHERLASETLRAVRTSLPDAARRIEPDENEQALIDDLPFTIDEDIAELAGASLLLGVRDNDLKGRGAEEVDQLASIHGDPDGQREHCLRRPEHDEPDGSEAALDECKRFLRERFTSALAALDDGGAPDAAKRVDLEVTLSVRGNLDASLPAFWVRIGQAMHALEDGFTHTYRTEDGMRVTAVANWIDVVNKKYDEARDGPPHSQELDRCDDPDALRSLRRSLATEASVSLLTAALDPGVPVDQRGASAEVIFDRYLSYEPGCTFQNAWCNAPERAYADDAGCACTTAGAPSPAPNGGLLLVAVGAVLVALRRRGGRRVAQPSRAGRLAAGGAACLAAASLALLPSPAAAQTPPPLRSRAGSRSAPAPAPAPAPLPLRRRRTPRRRAPAPRPPRPPTRADARRGRRRRPRPPPPGTTPTEARAPTSPPRVAPRKTPSRGDRRSGSAPRSRRRTTTWRSPAPSAAASA
ncbi:MAG: MYXO-CTERM sorting domain-containing protein [Polyangiaceae bacterium]